MGSGAGDIYTSTYTYRDGSEQVYAPHSAEAADALGQRVIQDAPKEMSRFERNVNSIRGDYELHTDGFFVERGVKPNIRVHRSDDPLKSSKDFFDRIAQGGQRDEKPGVDGYCEFSDGTRINFRIISRTLESPAVQISRSGTALVKDQKIHFVKEVQ